MYFNNLNILFCFCFRSLDELLSKFCDACLRKRYPIHSKVRTMCYECRELYCRGCADTHLTFKSFSDHTLINLDLPRSRQDGPHDDGAQCSSDVINTVRYSRYDGTELLSDVMGDLVVTKNTSDDDDGLMSDDVTNLKEKDTILNEDDALMSDFMEDLVETDNTIDQTNTVKKGKITKTLTASLVEAAIAQMTNMRKSKPASSAPKSPHNPSDVRVTKMSEFSTARQEDKNDVYITGVLILGDKFVIVDDGNKTLKLHRENGEYQSSIALPEATYGITQIDGDRFATCGYGERVMLWKMHENEISPQNESYKVDNLAHGIHFNGTYFCVLHNDDNAVTILGDRGRHIRKFVIKEAFGKSIKFGWDIHSDKDTHHVYIPCEKDNAGLLCVSVYGDVLQFNALSGSPHGITEAHGFLCLVDFENSCVNLISKDSKSQSKLLDENVILQEPYHIAVNASSKKLIVSYFMENVISVFSLK